MKSPIVSCAIILTFALGPLSFAHADSANNLRLRIKMEEGAAGKTSFALKKEEPDF